MTVGGRRVKGVEGSCEVNRLIGRYGPVIQKEDGEIRVRAERKV